MTRKLLWLGVLFVFLLVLLVGIVQVTAPKEAPVQKIELGDRTTLTFMGVSYGPTNSFLLGKPWQKYLYNLLPAKFKSWSRARMLTGVGRFSTNTPMFWIMKTRATNGSDSFYNTLSMDEYGCELANAGSGMSGSSVSETEWLFAMQFDPEPPYGKVVGIAIFDSAAKTNRLGVFLLPGTKLPPTTPASVLSETNNGDLTVQLVGLQTGLKAGSYPSYYPSNASTTFSQVTFRVLQNGRRISNWQPVSIELTSADGKVQHPRYRTAAARNGEGVFNFEGSLPPEKGPWKVRLEFTHETGFSPDELAVMQGVPFPAARETNNVGREIELQGRKIVVEQTYGSGAEPPSNLWFQKVPYVIVGLTPRDSSLHFRLTEARTESGKDLNSGVYGGGINGNYCFELQDFTNAQTLNLTFAMHRSRFVEFRANSSWYPTNQAAAK